MTDMEKVEKGLNICTSTEPCNGCPYLNERNCSLAMVADALALLNEQQQQILELQDQVEYLTDKLKEHDSLLGIQQTADGITFLSTGTAQQGEERGRLLGKLFMHDWLEKELLYRGLLTDDIRTVFDEAKRL